MCPILIVLDSLMSKETLMRNAHKLKLMSVELSKVWISNDLTSGQRSELKKLSQRFCGKMAGCEVQKLTDEGVVDGRASRKMIHATAQKLTMKNYNDLKIGLGLLNIRSIMSKYEMVCDIICGVLDILVLSETWYGLSDEFAVRCAMRGGYKFVDYVRPHDPYHGGIIIYFKKL
ncbi:hypothetical protein HELRODRAFT_158505 [Helobdella robusta]|uniref:Uncharacterized protein n=1 Tax=Helobdella robusta TaxID=6412 RepID=T1EMV4_HELRO|nr:hypothetical protein HELRODRAFT_158505 [Helobdella robusta]ESO12084.1 hypothetical protein HELRODRAFT_158505 [Helobdella robusta]